MLDKWLVRVYDAKNVAFIAGEHYSLQDAKSHAACRAEYMSKVEILHVTVHNVTKIK